MQNLFKLIYFYLKIDTFLIFVTGLYRNVSPAAAPQLLCQELLSFIFGSTYQGFTHGWRELSILSGRVQGKLKKILMISTNYGYK